MILPSLLPFIPESCAANYCTCMTTIFTSLMCVFWPEDVKLNKQNNIELEAFDFIVVGAGSAGCVVANRLTEIKEWNVLLLEAGGEEPVAADIPGFFLQLQDTAIAWNYTTQPEEGSCLMEKECSLPVGKVMGGTSTLNGMLYVRGNKEDYNNWSKLKNYGWSYDEILPYFKKSENNKDPEIVKQNPGYHATGGYLTVSKSPVLYSSGKVIEAAFNELGYPTIDVNGERQLGITYLQTTTENGVRKSTNAAFIRPIRGKRPNIVIKNQIFVTKILIDPITKKANGVEYTCTRTGTSKVVVAKKEVIVSAGTLNSPKLLMLSGVGPIEELEKHGINVIQNLSVGQNLQDHVVHEEVSGIIKNLTPDDNIDQCKNKVGNFSYYAETQRGRLSTMTPVALCAFVRTGYEKNKNVPDTQFRFSQNYENPREFRFLTLLINPMSRGFIKLNTTDPVWGSPLIYPRYLTAELDLKRIIQGIRIGHSLFNTSIMKKHKYELNVTPKPPCDKLKFNSDEYWACVVRQFAYTGKHLVGTCKMGPKEDSEAVVDPRLRVYGIKGLRIIDASVMTVVPRGNTNAPTIMIAEKASDMIKEDWLGKMKKVKKGKCRRSKYKNAD